MPPIVKTDEERVMEFFATAHPIKVQTVFNMIKPLVKARLAEITVGQTGQDKPAVANEAKKRGPKKSTPPVGEADSEGTPKSSD